MVRYSRGPQYSSDSESWSEGSDDEATPAGTAREAVEGTTMMEVVLANLQAAKDLGRAAQVSRRWRDAAQGEDVWKLACHDKLPLAVQLKAQDFCTLSWRELHLQHNRVRWVYTVPDQDHAHAGSAYGPHRDSDYYAALPTGPTEVRLPPIRVFDPFHGRAQYTVGVELSATTTSDGEVLATMVADLDLDAYDTRYELFNRTLDDTISFIGVAAAPVVKIWLIRNSDRAKLILGCDKDFCSFWEDDGLIEEDDGRSYSSTLLRIPGLQDVEFDIECDINVTGAKRSMVERANRFGFPYQAVDVPTDAVLTLHRIEVNLTDPANGSDRSANIDIDMLLQLVASRAVEQAWTPLQAGGLTGTYDTGLSDSCTSINQELQEHTTGRQEATGLELVEKAGLVSRILQRLDVKQLMCASQVNRKWHAASYHDEAWSLICAGSYSYFNTVRALPNSTVTFRQLYIQRFVADKKAKERCFQSTPPYGSSNPKITATVLPTEDSLSAYSVAIEIHAADAFGPDDEHCCGSETPVYSAVGGLPVLDPDPDADGSEYLFRQELPLNTLLVPKHKRNGLGGPDWDVKISLFLIRKCDSKMLCICQREQLDYATPSSGSCKSEGPSCWAPTCGERFPAAAFIPTLHMHPDEPEDGQQKKKGYWSVASIDVKHVPYSSSDTDEVEGVVGLLSSVGCPGYAHLWA